MPFRTGLCGCMMDKGGCCDIMCCTPCQLGRMCNALEGQPSTGNCLWCCLGTFIPAVTYVGAGVVRCKVVQKFDLSESPIISFCMCYFCWWCSFCQAHRELTLQGVTPGGVLCNPAPADQIMS